MASERKFITENVRRVLLKEYLMKAVDRAGFGGVEVQRTPMGTRVTLITERPGIVIGRKGAAIKSLTMAIEKDFKFDNPQVEVQEVDNPNLNAQIMAEKLAFALERGWHFRRAGHSTVRRVMDSGARGCHVVIAGKLTGERHRTEKFKEGYVKFCGEPKLKFIRQGFAVAKLKPGVIGVKVDIMAPDAKLPDEVDVVSPEEAAKILPEMVDKIYPKEEALIVTEAPKEEPAAAPEGQPAEVPTTPDICETPVEEKPERKKEGES